MALKDRIKNKKIEPQNTEITPEDNLFYSFEVAPTTEFNVPIMLLTQRILKIQDDAHLGSIVKEFAKFLDTLSGHNASLSLKGNFDIGKKTLISCLLASIYDLDSSPASVNVKAKTEKKVKETKEVSYHEPSLIKKRKNLKEKLKRRVD